MASKRPSSTARSSASIATADYPVAQSSHNPSPAQVTSLLLDVLRNVNREVRTSFSLNDNAAAAVVHYQAIAADLRTLADKPLPGNTGTPGTVGF